MRVAALPAARPASDEGAAGYWAAAVAAVGLGRSTGAEAAAAASGRGPKSRRAVGGVRRGGAEKNERDEG